MKAEEWVDTMLKGRIFGRGSAYARPIRCRADRRRPNRLGGLLLVAIVSNAVQSYWQYRRIRADGRLAEQRFEFEQRLARDKLQLEQEQALWKRHIDLAEQVLALFYEVREVFIWARSPGIFGGEGKGRKSDPEETEKQQQERNTYFIPLERLAKHGELFAKLETLRFAFAASYGREAIAPFQVIRELHGELTSTAGMLMQMTDADGSTAGYRGQDQGLDLRLHLWGGMNRPNVFDQRLDDAIVQIETSCRQVLDRAAP